VPFRTEVDISLHRTDIPTRQIAGISHYRHRRALGKPLHPAPDLIVGYNRNYRASWDTILGAYPKEQILDNLDPWSGDHCMDSQFLSGVFLSNRGNASENPALSDMAPTILAALGVPSVAEMTGKDILT
jgi:hypothetical protein